jgi:Na+/phosphate symporter
MSITQLRQVYIDIEETLRMIFESIRTEKTAFIDAVQSKVTSLRNRLASKVAAECWEGLEISESARISLTQITDRLVHLVELSQQKTQKHILFSDKAFQEIEYLFGSLKYLVRCLGEVEASRSSGATLLKYITDTAVALDEATQRCAAEHEERLIAGLCQPHSAPVYLDLLENIRQILAALKSLTREIQKAAAIS